MASFFSLNNLTEERWHSTDKNMCFLPANLRCFSSSTFSFKALYTLARLGTVHLSMVVFTLARLLQDCGRSQCSKTRQYYYSPRIFFYLFLDTVLPARCSICHEVCDFLILPIPALAVAPLLGVKSRGHTSCTFALLNYSSSFQSVRSSITKDKKVWTLSTAKIPFFAK